MNADNDESAIIRWVRFSAESLTKIDDIELAALKIHIVLEGALKFLLSKRLTANEDTDPFLRQCLKLRTHYTTGSEMI